MQLPEGCEEPWRLDISADAFKERGHGAGRSPPGTPQGLHAGCELLAGLHSVSASTSEQWLKIEPTMS